MGGYNSVPQLQIPDYGAKAKEMVDMSSLAQASQQRAALAPVAQQQAQATLESTQIANQKS
jgi:hypothetical protein